MNIATENFKLATFTLPERAVVLVLHGFLFLFFSVMRWALSLMGDQKAGHCVCCLPQRGGQRGRSQDTSPKGPQSPRTTLPPPMGRRSCRGETSTFCSRLLKQGRIKSLSPVFLRYHMNRNGHPPEVRARENMPSLWHCRGGCSPLPLPAAASGGGSGHSPEPGCSSALP